ncbi:hypothetical protein NDU88_012301 [Pleurodeles waltl]|uniref:Uncharacterized protein n=1 Tax=Pleurodeles waltl TaxID=8319 RepID=A0AAV7R1J9_PLEWA|nr:hypothetical protein NDU88_012301 [Pleurodeles waltl]
MVGGDCTWRYGCLGGRPFVSSKPGALLPGRREMLADHEAPAVVVEELGGTGVLIPGSERSLDEVYGEMCTLTKHVLAWLWLLKQKMKEEEDFLKSINGLSGFDFDMY